MYLGLIVRVGLKCLTSHDGGGGGGSEDGDGHLTVILAVLPLSLFFGFFKTGFYYVAGNTLNSRVPYLSLPSTHKLLPSDLTPAFKSYLLNP